MPPGPRRWTGKKGYEMRLDGLIVAVLEDGAWQGGESQTRPDQLRHSQLNKVRRHRSFHVLPWLPVMGRRDEERLGRIQTVLGQLGAEENGKNCSRPTMNG